jgi:hypothetical protein
MLESIWNFCRIRSIVAVVLMQNLCPSSFKKARTICSSYYFATPKWLLHIPPGLFLAFPRPTTDHPNVNMDELTPLTDPFDDPFDESYGCSKVWAD